MTEMTSSMSPCASTNRLPVSRASRRATSSFSSSSLSASRRSRSALSPVVVSRHGPESKASRAAATAAWASSGVASATVTTCSPSAGQCISRVDPSEERIHSPLINKLATTSPQNKQKNLSIKAKLAPRVKRTTQFSLVYALKSGWSDHAQPLVMKVTAPYVCPLPQGADRKLPPIFAGSLSQTSHRGLLRSRWQHAALQFQPDLVRTRSRREDILYSQSQLRRVLEYILYLVDCIRESRAMRAQRIAHVEEELMRIVVLVKDVPDTFVDRKLSLETGLADR